MAQAREILRRINSVKQTKQITRAMKMVAAAKLRRTQDQMTSTRYYANGLTEMLQRVTLDLIGDEHPLLQKRDVKRTVLIVLAGDRGLCGAFNTNILKAAKQYIASTTTECLLVPIGRRAVTGLRREKVQMLRSIADIYEKLSYDVIVSLCYWLLDLYLSKDSSQQIDSVEIIYNDFISAVSQKVTRIQLLPFDFKAIYEKQSKLVSEENGSTKPSRPTFSIEPSPKEMLEQLVATLLGAALYKSMLESYTAELSARMSAMDAATTSADDMICKLQLEYNRARQTGITNELLDIVTGANALE